MNESMNSQVAKSVSMKEVSQVADHRAMSDVFSDYQRGMANNTLRRQRTDLALFGEFLTMLGVSISTESLYSSPEAWAGISHGLVEEFLKYQLTEGFAIGSINVRLATIKRYCSLAYKAGILDIEAYGRIKLVVGFTESTGRHTDEKRQADGLATRIGSKKAEAVAISKEQAKRLKERPDTSQGRRDALLVCLLLDHGLRCGEIADLSADCISLDKGTITFFRKKVGKEQKHKLTIDTLIAATRYFEVASPFENLLMGSNKGGKLQGRMSERAITARMEKLCAGIGIEGASAHDGRHAWATLAAENGTDLKALQQGGGWSGLAMPARYIADSVIANEGVKLG